MPVVKYETFGPVSPVIRFSDIDEAIRIANAHRLRAVVGRVHQPARLHHAASSRDSTSASVNVREVPGYRLELTPFGGIKDSGLGYKEGVQEAMKSFTNIEDLLAAMVIAKPRSRTMNDRCRRSILPPRATSTLSLLRRRVRSRARAWRVRARCSTPTPDVFLHQSLSTPCFNALASCDGIWLTDVEGRRVMDFHGNNVHQVGYRHPHVMAAVQRAARHAALLAAALHERAGGRARAASSRRSRPIRSARCCSRPAARLRSAWR